MRDGIITEGIENTEDSRDFNTKSTKEHEGNEGETIFTQEIAEDMDVIRGNTSGEVTRGSRRLDSERVAAG